MSFELKFIVWALSVAMVFGALFGVFSYGKYVTNLKRDKIDNEAAIKQQAYNHAVELAYAEKLTEAQIQNEHNQVFLAQRDDYIDSLRSNTKTITYNCSPETSQSSNPASGVAATGINGYIAISPNDRDRIIETYKRCAQLNIDTIRLNNSLH